MKPPKRLWVVADLESPAEDGVLGWFSTRREARERCAAFNRMCGYEPSCVVVRYDCAMPKRGDSHG